MKGILRKLFYLSIIVAFIFAAYSGVKISNGSSFWIVEDLRSGDISVYSKKYNFVWQAMAPALFSVSELNKNCASSFDLKIGLIDFPKNSPDYYSAKFSVNAQYQVIPESAASAGLFAGKQESHGKFVKVALEKAFFIEMARFIRPFYRPLEIESSRDLIIRAVSERLKKDLKPFGIDLMELKYSSAMVLPELNVYNEGLDHLARLRRLDIAGDIEMRSMNSRIEREGISNEQYYKKLLRIADIIKGRPDILKYIYIDKLSDNVKLVISPDKTGLPLFLGTDSDEKQAKKGSIDNLR